MKTSKQNPVVAWHDGGPLWAGDTDNHPEGWYIFSDYGTTPQPCRVLVPFTNDEMTVSSD